MPRIAVLVAACGLAVSAAADDSADGWADNDRAHVNYMLHCQGCHLPDASGTGEDVPRMNGFLGYFLHGEEGRAFIVQVPGVSTAQLPDDEIAELLNWLLERYSPGELPADFVPYTAAEVRTLRQTPEDDPGRRRKAVLRDIAEANPALSGPLGAYRSQGN